MEGEPEGKETRRRDLQKYVRALGRLCWPIGLLWTCLFKEKACTVWCGPWDPSCTFGTLTSFFVFAKLAGKFYLYKVYSVSFFAALVAITK